MDFLSEFIYNFFIVSLLDFAVIIDEKILPHLVNLTLVTSFTDNFSSSNSWFVKFLILGSGAIVVFSGLLIIFYLITRNSSYYNKIKIFPLNALYFALTIGIFPIILLKGFPFLTSISEGMFGVFKGFHLAKNIASLGFLGKKPPEDWDFHQFPSGQNYNIIITFVGIVGYFFTLYVITMTTFNLLFKLILSFISLPLFASSLFSPNPRLKIWFKTFFSQLLSFFFLVFLISFSSYFFNQFQNHDPLGLKDGFLQNVLLTLSLLAFPKIFSSLISFFDFTKTTLVSPKIGYGAFFSKIGGLFKKR